MFIPFSVGGRAMRTRVDWTRYVTQPSIRRRYTLMQDLRCVRGGRIPVFSRAGRGKTLLQWARQMRASYTLMQEVVYA